MFNGFRHYGTTIARLNSLDGLERGGRELLSVCGCDFGEIGPPNCTPYQRGGPIAVEGVEQRQYSIQPVEGATKTGLSEGQHLSVESLTGAEGSSLSLPKIAIAIAAFSNRKFKIATLTAGSAEKSQNEIPNR